MTDIKEEIYDPNEFEKDLITRYPHQSRRYGNERGSFIAISLKDYFKT